MCRNDVHILHCHIVLETLRDHKLYANASKCQFGSSSVGFLGPWATASGIGMDPRNLKVAAGAAWATPASEP